MEPDPTYTPPRLEVLGTLSELTLGADFSLDDDGLGLGGGGGIS